MWIVFPLVPNSSAVQTSTIVYALKSIPSINGVLVCWSVTEVVRYSFYTLKDAEILKHLRYNLFLVLYPFGVSFELISVTQSCFYVANLPAAEKPLTLTMPNKYNFIYKYEWTVYVIFLIYLSEFPKLFNHMLRQRAKIYTKVVNVELLVR